VLKPLTISVNYYGQAECLAATIDRWQSLPAEVLNQIRFIVVDDGSRVEAGPVVAPLLKGAELDFVLYRILVDIPFNFAGTINLAAAMADTPWILHHDLDHRADAELLRSVLALAIPDNRNRMFLFRLKRERETIDHPSSHLLTLDWFWRIGGSDEDFSGEYGYDDVYFIHKARQAIGLDVIQSQLAFSADRRGESAINRDSQRNERLLRHKLAAPPARGVNVLRFPWEQVLSTRDGR
jgi:hypothetical protein